MAHERLEWMLLKGLSTAAAVAHLVIVIRQVVMAARAEGTVTPDEMRLLLERLELRKTGGSCRRVHLSRSPHDAYCCFEKSL